jgi:hypothetical protein
MSDVVSKVDSLKFENKIRMGDHSPKLQKRMVILQIVYIP